MRTAQSVPSTTTRRPVREERAVDVQIDRVVGLAVELDHRARRQPDDLRRSGMRVRPSSAQTRTRDPRASDGFAGERRGGAAARGAAAAASSEPRSSSALDMRTTNALGTSWTSRHGSPQTGTSRGRRAASAGRRRRPRRRRRRSWSPACRSRPRCRARRGRAGGRGHHLVHRLGDGGQLELGQLGRRPAASGAPCPSSRRRAAARRRA